MRIAVIGCSHGSLDDIYASAAKCDAEAKARGEPQIELILCCGDFQAMRALPDLEAMACPVKYRALGQFHNYYAQRKKAPYLTIVIGGNHEASGYMWETFHGGWLAPDIYFLGFAGCMLVDGWLRIAGTSGIWKRHDYKKGHFEQVPYNDSTIRSVYHIREYEVERLKQLKERGPVPDIFMSHEWPVGIEQHGDTPALLREKPWFTDDIRNNSLGAPPLHDLLQTLQPKYWFSAHLHVKFAALYHHNGTPATVKGRGRPAPAAAAAAVAVANPDEIQLEDDDEEEPATPAPEAQEAKNEDEIMIDEEEEEDEPAGVFSEEKKGSGCECAGGGEAGHTHEGEIEAESEGDDDAESKLVEDLLVNKVAAGLAEGSRTTKFLALSKPGPGKDFLQVLDIPSRPGIPHPTPPPSDATDATAAGPAAAEASPPKPTLYFDPHWLAIVRALHPSLSTTYQPMLPFPPPAQTAKLIDDNLAWVKANVGQEGILPVKAVQRFVKTAPADGEGDDYAPPAWYTNPQTEALCDLLKIENRINPVPAGFKEAQAAAAAAAKEAEGAKAEEMKEWGRLGEERKAAALAEAKRAALAMVDADGEGGNGDEIVVEDEEDE